MTQNPTRGDSISAEHSSPTGRPQRRAALTALAAMSLVYFFSYFQRVAVPGTVFNEIQTDLGLSAAAVTALGSVFLYVYAGMQLVVGMAADRFGGVRMLLLGGLVMCIGSIIFPLSTSLWMLYASRALTGLGGSFMFLCLVREIATCFAPLQFPVLMGAVLLVGYAGGVAATAPFERVVAGVGWRNGLLGAGVLACLSLAVAWLLLRRLKLPERQGQPISLRPLVRVLTNRRSLPLLVCGLINFPVYFVIQSTLGKKFLEDYAGLSSAEASNFTFAMMLATAVLVFASGYSLRLIGHRRKPCLVLAAVLVLGASLLMLLGVRNGWGGGLFLLCYLMLGASTSLSPAIEATMKELNRADAVALSLGVYNLAAYIGVAVLANVSGVVMDHFSGQAAVTPGGTIYPPQAYLMIFAVLSAMGVVSVVCSLLVPETGLKLRAAENGRPANGE